MSSVVSRFLILFLAVVLAACATTSAQPPAEENLSTLATDEVSGVAFLAPVGDGGIPSSVFDPTLNLHIEFFEVENDVPVGTPVGPSYATADGSIIVSDDGYYQANWDTRASSLPDGATVRAEVRLEHAEPGQPACTSDTADLSSGCLAFFDVQLWQNKGQAKRVQQFTPEGSSVDEVSVELVNGQTLPIKVFVEEGAVCITSIPDPVLKELVLGSLYRSSEPRVILCADMQQLKGLNGTNRGITDLTGLEHATNIWVLYLGGNSITDITPLAGLTNLENLELYRNRIADISPLANLTKLTRLLLSYNYSVEDISALANLTELRQLSLNHNLISDISPLTALSKVTGFNLSSNRISDLTPLADLPHLRGLNLSWNRISDISVLANLKELEYLELSVNDIKDIAPLTELTGIRDLNLFGNNITDITPLAGLTNLTSLGVGQNRVEDIAPVEGLHKLGYLHILNNHIRSLAPLVRNPGIGEGDRIYVTSNCLDLSDEQVAQEVATLLDRGVYMDYEYQWDLTGPRCT